MNSQHNNNTVSRKSDFFDPIASFTKFPEQAKQHIINQLEMAILNQNINYLSVILGQFPILINYPLNEANQTALILAVKAQSVSSIEYLSNNGADPDYYDSMFLCAKDYTSINCNEFVLKYLENIQKHVVPTQPTIVIIQSAIHRLKTRIATKLESLGHENEIERKVLSVVLLQLNRSEIEQNNPAKLLDLYVTANTIAKTCSDNDDTQANMLDFFAVRETILCGRNNDYCHQLSLANQLCCQLAEMISGDDENPANILFRQATTLNRKSPWMNMYLQTPNLPDSPTEYFRTIDNRIHIYQGILERAITNLKLGYTQLHDIWHGTDSEDAGPLTPYDLDILRQRTPSFDTLVAYTKQLRTASKKVRGNLFERLSRLRQGLLNGDVKHYVKLYKDTEDYIYKGLNDSLAKDFVDLEAAPPANIAIAEFADWWNTLGSTTKERIKLVADGELGRVLDIILDPSINKQRDGVNYCIDLKGGDLQRIIDNDKTRSEIYQLTHEIDPRKSDEELEQLKSDIIDELETTTPDIKTRLDIFSKLTQNKVFMHLIETNDDIDYFPILKIIHSNELTTAVLSAFFDQLSTQYIHQELINLIQNTKLSETVQVENTIVKMLINLCGDTSLICDADGNNLLHIALAQNQPTWIISLLCQNQKLITNNKQGQNLLQLLWSTQTINLTTLTYFIQNLAKYFSAQEWGITLLCLIDTTEHYYAPQLAKELLRKVPDVLQIKHNDLYVLDYAMQKTVPDIELIRLLFKNNSLYEKDAINQNAFQACIAKGQGTSLINQLLNEFPETLNPVLEKVILDVIERGIDSALQILLKFVDRLSPEAYSRIMFQLIIVDRANTDKLAKSLLQKRSLTAIDDCQSGGFYAIHLLLATKIEPDIDLIQLLCKDNNILTKLTNQGKSSLDYALENNHRAVIQLFITQHAEKFPQASLEKALVYLIPYQMTDAAKSLLRQFPDLAHVDYRRNGCYPIHYAVKMPSLDKELIRLLCKNRSILQMQVKGTGLTPIQILAEAEKVDEIKFLIEEFGLDNFSSQFSRTLQLAASTKSYQSVQYLIDNHLNHLTTNDIETLLPFAILDQPTLAKQLLIKYPHLSRHWVVNGNYITHLAVQSKQPDLELIKLLCADNTVLQERDDNGQTILDLIPTININVAMYFIEAFPNQLDNKKLDALLKNIIKNKDYSNLKTILRQWPDLAKSCVVDQAHLVYILMQDVTPDYELMTLLFSDDTILHQSNHPSEFTPFEFAVSLDNNDLVAFFLNNYQDSFSTDEYNMVLSIARLSKKNLCEFLMENYIDKFSKKAIIHLVYKQIEDNRLVKIILHRRPEIFNDEVAYLFGAIHLMLTKTKAVDMALLQTFCQYTPEIFELSNEHHETLIDIAIRTHKQDAIKYFIQHWIAYFNRNGLSKSLLLLIPYDINLAKLLLQQRPDISTLAYQVKGSVALHLALKSPVKDLSFLALLCNEKDALKQLNGEGKTPLMIAMSNGDVASINFFLTNHFEQICDQLEDVIDFMVKQTRHRLTLLTLFMQQHADKFTDQHLLRLIENGNLDHHQLLLILQSKPAIAKAPVLLNKLFALLDDEKINLKLFALLCKHNADSLGQCENQCILIMAGIKNKFEYIEHLLANYFDKFDNQQLMALFDTLYIGNHFSFIKYHTNTTPEKVKVSSTLFGKILRDHSDDLELIGSICLYNTQLLDGNNNSLINQLFSTGKTEVIKLFLNTFSHQFNANEIRTIFTNAYKTPAFDILEIVLNHHFEAIGHAEMDEVLKYAVQKEYFKLVMFLFEEHINKFNMDQLIIQLTLLITSYREYELVGLAIDNAPQLLQRLVANQSFITAVIETYAYQPNIALIGKLCQEASFFQDFNGRSVFNIAVNQAIQHRPVIFNFLLANHADKINGIEMTNILHELIQRKRHDLVTTILHARHHLLKTLEEVKQIIQFLQKGDPVDMTLIKKLNTYKRLLKKGITTDGVIVATHNDSLFGKTKEKFSQAKGAFKFKTMSSSKK